MESESRTSNPRWSEEFLLGTANAPQGGLTRSQNMSAIPAEAGAPCSEAYTPPAWEVFYKFARLVCVGFMVTFGPRRAHVPRPTL
jgi:hypothetical protein